MTRSSGPTQDVFRAIFNFFNAPVVDIDCGQKCAHLNGGSPVCCDTTNAVPIVQKAEFKALKARTDMWRKFKPGCTHTHALVDSLHHTCQAVECRGAMHCERDNRSVSCRTFPFFPYITNKDELIGLGYYWDFEDRCWVISNMARVTPDFVREFLKCAEMLFEADPLERQVYRDFSATMRRVFSRKGRSIFLIDRDGGYLEILPKGAGVKKASPGKLPKFEPFRGARR